jgi:uncharacterized protein (DUF305 family)
VSSTEGETSMDHSGDHGTETTRSGMGPGRLAVLVAAVAFLAGAIGWAVGGRQSDPLNSADVGFMQDMTLHHDQAIQMSLLLLGKEDVDSDLLQYAQEIVISQRFDQGVFNATLDRFGHRSAPDDTVMGWMGHAMAPDEMPGLATEDQMRQLRQASGEEAAALWIALMSEHHLGGMHMAAEAVDRGQDQTVVNLARGNQTVQADEVLELSRYRLRNGLPIPDGFTDPVEDEMVQARVAQMQGG